MTAWNAGLDRQSIEFDGFRLDAQRRRLTTIDGTTITLTSRAFDTLLVLVARRGETVSKQELLDAVWPSVVVEENNLNQAISTLRKTLGDTEAPHRLIRTIPGRGYCFIAEIRSVDAAPDAGGDVAPMAPAARTLLEPRHFWWRWLGLAVVATALSSLLVLRVVLKEQHSELPMIAPPQSAQPVELPLGTGTAAIPLPNSIAVLPFSTQGTEPEYEYLGFGLHDEVLTQLEGISALNVIASNTILQYRHSGKNASQIAKELNVGVILEGSVSTMRSQLRLALRMTDPHTNLILWSHTYDVNSDSMGEILAMQRDILLQVTDTLAPELNSEALIRVSLPSTTSAAAYRRYLESSAALIGSNYAKALTLLDDAVRLDPRFGAAWSRKSMLHTVMTTAPTTTPGEQQQLAVLAATRALAIDPELPQAHLAMAAARHSAGDWQGAAAEYAGARKRGVALGTSPLYSLFQLSLADYSGARATLQRNLRTDPINLIARGFLMLAHEFLGERRQSREEYQRGEALYADWWGDNTGVWLALGRRDKDFLAKAVREYPSYSLRSVLEVYDDPNAALALLRDIAREPAEYRPGQLLNGAMFAAYYNEPALALDLLRQGLRQNGVSFYVVWLPVFDTLRNTAEFKQILVESGIVDYWRQAGFPEICRPLPGDDFECGWQAVSPASSPWPSMSIP